MAATTTWKRLNRSSYVATCAACGLRINKGEGVLWSPETRAVKHVNETICNSRRENPSLWQPVARTAAAPVATASNEPCARCRTYCDGDCYVR